MSVAGPPPRVLLCARPGTGGAARVIEASLRRLPEKGVTGTAALSTLEGEDLLDVARDHGWDVVPLDLRREMSPVRDAVAGMRLRKLLPGHDLVHAHAAKAGAVARLVTGRFPVVYTPHGFYFSYHPEGSKPWKRYLGLEKRLAARTSVLHCVSDSERDLALHHGLADDERAVVLHNPVPPRRPGPDPTATLAAMGIGPGEPVFLMAARLAEPKDPVTFVRAAAMVPPALGARFVLTGEGPLLEAAREADTGAVAFAGHDVDVRGLLAQSHAAVLSSRSEAMPLFLLEALAEGVPAVAPDLPGCHDASDDAALYVPPGDPGALAAAVERLLREPDLHDGLARRARDRAPRFDEDTWLDALIDLYKRALLGGVRGGR